MLQSLEVIYVNIMASVAKWLRHWVVVPAFAGSIPVVRPLSTFSLSQDKHLSIALI